MCIRDRFWTGESWEIPGDSFELSYNLTQVLWRKIEADLAAPRSEILQFILDAHFDDGGEAACQAIFDLSLGDLVMDFLGEGEWAPTPNEWPNNASLSTPAPPRVQFPMAVQPSTRSRSLALGQV